MCKNTCVERYYNICDCLGITIGLTAYILVHPQAQMFLMFFFLVVMGHFDWPITKNILKFFPLPLPFPTNKSDIF